MTTNIQKKTNEENKLVIMNAIKKLKTKHLLKQKDIALLLNIKQPRVSDLVNLKHEKFSIDILMNYFAEFGFVINFEEVDTSRGKPVKAKITQTKAVFS